MNNTKNNLKALQNHLYRLGFKKESEEVGSLIKTAVWPWIARCLSNPACRSGVSTGIKRFLGAELVFEGVGLGAEAYLNKAESDKFLSCFKELESADIGNPEDISTFNISQECSETLMHLEPILLIDYLANHLGVTVDWSEYSDKWNLTLSSLMRDPSYSAVGIGTVKNNFANEGYKWWGGNPDKFGDSLDGYISFYGSEKIKEIHRSCERGDSNIFKCSWIKTKDVISAGHLRYQILIVDDAGRNSVYYVIENHNTMEIIKEFSK